MTLTQLEHQFPGLFVPGSCQSQSDAERHADEVAARSGLTVRVSSWTTGGCTSGGGGRLIEYRDTPGKLRLSVDIRSESGRGNRPFYLFRCSGERLDAHLTIQGPHTVRANPSTFQREAQALVTKLRSLRVQDGGRITGQLKRWDPELGRGAIECIPGVFVSLNAIELAAGLSVSIRDWLSFIVKPGERQEATDIRRCSPQ